jgi:hypothetical protein
MSATHNNTGRARKTSGDIHATPGATTTRVFCKNTISEQFAARTIKILELPAFRVLSLSTRRGVCRRCRSQAHRISPAPELPTFQEAEIKARNARDLTAKKQNPSAVKSTITSSVNSTTKRRVPFLGRGKIGFDYFGGWASFQAGVDCAVRDPRLKGRIRQLGQFDER